MNDWDGLDVFLQKYNYNYMNDRGIMFNRVAAGFMFVSSPWPGYNDINKLSLVYLCNDASKFFKGLEIENAEQLERVHPEVLLKLFYAGDVILTCTLRGETLEFQLENGKLIANKEECCLRHEVQRNLETPKDFIEYTNQYFHKRKEEPALKN